MSREHRLIRRGLPAIALALVGLWLLGVHMVLPAALAVWEAIP